MSISHIHSQTAGMCTYVYTHYPQISYLWICPLAKKFQGRRRPETHNLPETKASEKSNTAQHNKPAQLPSTAEMSEHKHRCALFPWLLLLFIRPVVSNSATMWTVARQASLSFTISQSLLKLMSIESVIPSNHLILCCPLLLLPSSFPSIRGFSNELALCIRWPKYWSFNFRISPSNEYTGLISFRIDWFDLLSVQGTLKSSLTPQFNSINSLMLSPTLTFIHDYGKTIALARWSLLAK